MGLNELKVPEFQKNTVERASYFIKNDRSYQRNGDDYYLDTLETKITSVGTTATRIETPDSAHDFVIFHQEAGKSFHIGDEDVTVSQTILYEFDEAIFENMKKDDDNEIYGITASGTVNVIAVGIIKS